MVSISAPRVAAPDRMLQPGTVHLSGDRVTAVTAGAEGDVRLDDGVLCPGLVDIQVNGYFGYDFVEADPAGWEAVCRRLPETGVTSFQPTFISAPVEQLAEALRRTSEIFDGLADGLARPVGVHLEGPFLSAQHHGAHDPSVLVDPVPQAIRTLLDASPGLLTMLTLAPERAGAEQAIRDLVAAGVVVSVGHSDATAAQTQAAASAGATLVTHLFNAQRGLHHREPGIAGQGLVDPRLHPGVIADLTHLDGAVLTLVFAAAGDRAFLVTDAASAAGMPPGDYVLGGQRIIQPAAGPPLREDGTIAGSGLRMDDAVANVAGLGVDLHQVIRAATRLPADLLGRTDIGRLAPGVRADMVWLDDHLRTRATWIGGRQVFGEPVGGTA